MVTMAQSAATELAQHALTLTWIARIQSHTYTNIVMLCKAPAQLLKNLTSNFYFEGTRGRGSKLEYPEKTTDSLPANRYHIILLKIQRPGWELNPYSRSHIGDKITWPRAHAASDPLSYRMPLTYSDSTHQSSSVAVIGILLLFFSRIYMSRPAQGVPMPRLMNQYVVVAKCEAQSHLQLYIPLILSISIICSNYTAFKK